MATHVALSGDLEDELEAARADAYRVLDRDPAFGEKIDQVTAHVMEVNRHEDPGELVQLLAVLTIGLERMGRG